MLQHRVQDLHVVRIPGIGQLIEDHQLHHSAQVVSVCVEQLPGQLVAKKNKTVSVRVSACFKVRSKRNSTDLTHSM